MGAGNRPPPPSARAPTGDTRTHSHVTPGSPRMGAASETLSCSVQCEIPTTGVQLHPFGHMSTQGEVLGRTSRSGPISMAGTTCPHQPRGPAHRPQGPALVPSHPPAPAPQQSQQLCQPLWDSPAPGPRRRCRCEPGETRDPCVGNNAPRASRDFPCSGTGGAAVIRGHEGSGFVCASTHAKETRVRPSSDSPGRWGQESTSPTQ